MSQFDAIDREFRLLRLRERLQKVAAGGVWNTFKEHVVGGLGTGTAAAALTAGAMVGGYGIGRLKDTIVKGRAMKSMIEANPSLAKKDSKQVHLAFNSVYHLNPDLATDPLVAGSAVSRFLDRSEMGGEPYVDPQTAMTISRGHDKSDPVLDAFISGASKYRPEKPEKPEKPVETLAEKAKLKQYESQLRKYGPEHAFGAGPPAPATPAPKPTPRQQAEAKFPGRK